MSVIGAYLLPAPYDETAFIAGGFAACPALAEDVDLWCPVDTTDANDPFVRVWEERDRVADSLRAAFGAWFTEHDGNDTVRSKPPLPPHILHGKLRSTFEGYHLAIPIRRVGVLDIPGHSLPYHIIMVGADIDEVLSSFDISTHQVALTSRGVVRGEHYTAPFEPPVVIQQKYTTDARIARIRQRYHL